jgi:hypothetical protein
MDTMIKANLNPKYEILERDKNFYHVKLEKRIIDPKDPTRPIIRSFVQAIRPIDWQKYFACKADLAVEYLKAMNCSGSELVHDPSLLSKKEREVKPEPKSAELIAREKLVKVKNRGDVEQMMNKGASDE